MSDIYLIRHGFTPANNANYNNQRNLWMIAEDKDMPLELDYGIRQALELGEFLKSIKGTSLVLVSPYKRARQTLEIALGSNIDNYLVLTLDELRENNSGIHYAKTKDEILEMEPLAVKFFEEIKVNPESTSYIGGESMEDVKNRVKDLSFVIKRISDSNIYDNIFIFAHGTVNNIIYYLLNGKYMNKQKNCEVIKANGSMSGESIFLPDVWVPLGYEIDINKYIKT